MGRIKKSSRTGQGATSALIVPLVGVVGSWAAIVATAPTGGTPVAEAAAPAAPAPVTASQNLDAPVTTPVSSFTTRRAAGNVDASQIPSPALAAYQRAATIVNATDASCRLNWQLLAAVGRVESNHGTFNGSTLDQNGVANPPIIGIALNGKNGTRKISDTDAGQYDGDQKFDRAVGPMQFIPSTWALIGADADADGVRNPQDVDDAALASAIHLCSGDGDLSTEKDRAAALLRYNRSQAYVQLVLQVMHGYEKTPTLAMPAAWYTTPTTPINTSLLSTDLPPANGDSNPAPSRGPRPNAGWDRVPQPFAAPVPPEATTPTEPEQPTEPEPEEPTTPTEPTPETPTEPEQPTTPTEPTPEPTPEPSPEPSPEPTPGPEPAPQPTPVPVDPTAVATAVEAVAAGCEAQGLVDDKAIAGDAFDTCVAGRLPTVAAELGHADDLATADVDESAEFMAAAAAYLASREATVVAPTS